MPHLRNRRGAVVWALVLGIALCAAGPAMASSDHATVKVKDDCDPATFDAALNDPNACVGDGETTFGAFFAEFLARHSVEDWTFDSTKLKLDAGGTIRAVNEGGEFHTFTEVQSFGGGCVPPLNQFEPVLAVPVGQTALDCATAGGGVEPGGSFATAPLAAGTHMFQCLVHPWMRAVAIVRGRDSHDDGD
jgi:plastocyanin